MSFYFGFLLEIVISNKKTEIVIHMNSARTNFSQIDFYLTNHWINKDIQKGNKTTLITHRKNLYGKTLFKGLMFRL